MKITPIGAAGGEVTGSCYSVQGSLGRLLVDGKAEVKIFGETIAVKAKIHTLGGFSAQQKFRLPSKSPAMGEVIEL